MKCETQNFRRAGNVFSLFNIWECRRGSFKFRFLALCCYTFTNLGLCPCAQCMCMFLQTINLLLNKKQKCTILLENKTTYNPKSLKGGGLYVKYYVTVHYCYIVHDRKNKTRKTSTNKKAALKQCCIFIWLVCLHAVGLLEESSTENFEYSWSE